MSADCVTGPDRSDFRTPVWFIFGPYHDRRCGGQFSWSRASEIAVAAVPPREQAEPVASQQGEAAIDARWSPTQERLQFERSVRLRTRGHPHQKEQTIRTVRAASGYANDLDRIAPGPGNADRADAEGTGCRGRLSRAAADIRTVGYQR